MGKVSQDTVVGGDWKCGSRKCDTGKIARMENAAVEKSRSR